MHDDGFTYFLSILLMYPFGRVGGGGGIGGSCNIIKENIYNNIMKEFFLEIIWLK